MVYLEVCGMWGERGREREQRGERESLNGADFCFDNYY